MPRAASLVVCVPLLLGFSGAFAAAQPASPEVSAEQVDVGDLWRKVRGKPPDTSTSGNLPDRRRGFIIAPTIGSRPDTGVTLGVAGNITNYFGDPQTTRISTGVFGLSFSTKKQTSLNVRLTAFTNEDRWIVVGENRFSWTSQDTFGLGTSASGAGEVNAKYDFFKISETVFRNVGPSRFLGAGVHVNLHRDIRPGEGDEAAWDQSPSVVYSRAHELPIDSATSNGFSFAARFDSRDNQIDARRGWFANSSYQFFFENLFGGDSSWQQVDVDVRAYRNLRHSERHRVAAWLLGAFVTGGVPPYYHLPATGTDTFGRSGRGYQEGRFRGDQLMYVEVEYRTTLTANGLVGLVIFVNGTTTRAPDGGEPLFHAVAVGSGFGARLLLSKRSRTNLCLDFGWGREGSRGVYLAVQEAF